MSNDISPQLLSDLRRDIVTSFNTEELRNLCADLGIDYENLGGEGREAKARELIAYANRHGRLSELVAYCISVRPKFTWTQDARNLRLSVKSCDVGLKITILFIASEPTDLAHLRLSEEVREIQEKLQMAKLRDRFDFHQRMSTRTIDLSQAMLDVQPQIVHFSGHGSIDGALCFENQSGQTDSIQPSAIAALFKQFSNHVNCVMLNACYTEIQAKAIAQYIEYVIGMNQMIGDKAAIAFAIGFYQALGAGRTIEDAYKLGCVQIRLHGIPEHQTPVLIKKGEPYEY